MVLPQVSYPLTQRYFLEYPQKTQEFQDVFITSLWVFALFKIKLASYLKPEGFKAFTNSTSQIVVFDTILSD